MDYPTFLATYPLQQKQIGDHIWEYIDTQRGAEVLLLLPGGFGLAHTSWQYVLAFAHHYRVVSLHYPAGIAVLKPLCRELVGLLDALQIAQAHVLGGSASGAVAQVLVRHARERVRSLILAQTGPPQPARARWATRWARLVERLPLPISKLLLQVSVWGFLPLPTASQRFWRAHFRSVIAAQNRESLANRFHLLADYDANYRFAAEDLGAWPGRVAIIESARDAFVGGKQQQTLRALYPQAAIHRFAKGSHGVSLHNPQAQIEAIATFLARQ
jgi:pimeloyl-ACP methyl ester carboxylesterase